MSDISDILRGVTEADVFAALANPVRRRLVKLLADEPRNAGALAGEFELSRAAVSEHLRVLRDAGLVRDMARGRERIYELDGRPLAEVSDWLRPLERYWRTRLSGLADLVEKENES